MKKLLLILTVFISLKVSGQINAVNDTTRITASSTFSAQFVPNIFNSGGVNYRVTYVYNPSTQKYDAVVYSKYLRRFYIAKSDSSSNYISPWQFNHGNNTIGGTWEFKNNVTFDASANITGLGNFGVQNLAGTIFSNQEYNGFSVQNYSINSGASKYQKDVINWNNGTYDFQLFPPASVTGQRGIYFPDKSGTVALTTDVSNLLSSNNTWTGTNDFNKITVNSITIDPGAFGGILIQKDSIKTVSSGTGIFISPQQYLSLSPRDGTIVTGNMFEKDSRWALNSGDAHFAVNPADGSGGIYISNTGANAQLSFGGDGTKTPVTLTYGNVYPTTADGYLYIRGGSYGTTSLGHVVSSNELSSDSTYNAATYVPLTRQIINGYAITGGGTLGTDRTLAVDSTLQASKTYVQNYTSGLARLNGTGFVKASGTAISYDNTSYLPITGGTLTGTLSSGSTISSTSTVRAGNIALTTIPSLGASVGFTPMMGSASSSAGIVGVEVYTQDGTNNRRAGLVMNQTDNVWGLGYASSSGSSPFVIKSGSTEWLRISTAGAVQLGQYTTAGVLTNDASGNIISTTVATANIANNAVTYAKMQAMTTNKLLGSGSGTAVSEITLGNGLSFSGTTLNTSRSHTIFTPTTGGTVTLVNNQENIINPAGSLVTVTLALPSSPSNNDKVDITFTQSVTTINYSGGTVVGGLTTVAQGGQYHLTYDSGTTTWY